VSGVVAADANGNRTSVSTSAGTTAYAYDNRNRLDTATLDGTDQVTFDYEADGLVDVVHFPNGTVTDYDYDEHNRVSRIRHQQGTAPRQ